MKLTENSTCMTVIKETTATDNCTDTNSDGDNTSVLPWQKANDYMLFAQDNPRELPFRKCRWYW